MTWPTPLLPSPPPPTTAATESITSTSTATHTPPIPPPIVTIQTARRNHDAEEMASRIERLQESRGGVEGSTRERLYRKLVEEGFITRVANAKEKVGREVKKEPRMGGGEEVGIGGMGPMVADNVKRGSEEVGVENGKGLDNMRIARNAERALRPGAVNLQYDPIQQGTKEREEINLSGGGGVLKGIPTHSRQREEGSISKFGEAQLGSHDQQHCQVDTPPAGHRAGSARVLVSPVTQVHSTSTSLSASQHSSKSSTANRVTVSSTQQPERIQEQTTVSVNMPPEPLGDRLLRCATKRSFARTEVKTHVLNEASTVNTPPAPGPSVPEPAGDRALRRSTRASMKAQATIHASYEVLTEDTPLALGPSVPEPAPLSPITPVWQELPKHQAQTTTAVNMSPEPAGVLRRSAGALAPAPSVPEPASLSPITPVSQELPKQDERKSIPAKQAPHVQSTKPKPKPRREKRLPSPVRVPGHSYTSTGRHHTKCKQCNVVRDLEVARMRAELPAKCPDPILRKTAPFGHYPDDEDWQKTSMARRNLETRNPFLGSTSSSLTSEMAGHMPSTGMGIRSRTEGGAWDMPPVSMYTGTPSGVDSARQEDQDAQGAYGPDSLQSGERDPNISRARQEDLNFLVRTNQITALDLLAEVALADWRPEPPRPWTGRPTFPESNMRGVREDPKLNYGRRECFTEEDRAMTTRAMATRDDTIYEGEICNQKSNGRDTFPTGTPGQGWNENRAIRDAQEDIYYAYLHDKKHTLDMAREPILYGQGTNQYAPRDFGGTDLGTPAFHAPVTPIMERHIFKVNQGESKHWYSLMYSPITNAMQGDYETTIPMLDLNHQRQVFGQYTMEREGPAALEENEAEEAFILHLAAEAPNVDRNVRAVKGVWKAAKNEEKGSRVVPKIGLGNSKRKVEEQRLGRKEEVDPDKTDTDSELEISRSQSWKPSTEKGAIAEYTMGMKAATQVESGGKRSATDAELEKDKIQWKRAKMDGDKATMLQHFSEGEKESSSGNGVKPAKPVIGFFTEELIQMILPKNVPFESEKAELDGGEKENQVIKEGNKVKVRPSPDGGKQGGNGVGAEKSAIGLFNQILPKDVEELEEGEIYEGKVKGGSKSL
ncbi:hypothetical protein BGX38DRAFT_1219582 [Terfezia claveryi]|nr:hypothetical protein BGX38DRAFT_1219582 [Terfezia claveryi]